MLVSVGIPVYNRLEGFERALKSALSQSYTNIEILISNDNSPNPAIDLLAKKYAEKDKRIKYYYQKSSKKTVNNFKFLPSIAKGKYFIWIADDDWIDENYVENCAFFLEENPSYSLACGLCNYHVSENVVLHNNSNFSIEYKSRMRRVLCYYSSVTINGYFYGVLRKDILDKFDIPDEIAFDWSLIGYFAFKGKIKTLENTIHHLSKGGMSNESSEVSKYFSKTTFIKRNLIGFATAVNCAKSFKNYFIKESKVLSLLQSYIYSFSIFLVTYSNTIKWDFIILKRIILKSTNISKSGVLKKQ